VVIIVKALSNLPKLIFIGLVGVASHETSELDDLEWEAKEEV